MAKFSSRSHERRCEGGFSLIEVMISTLVLTVGLMAMAQLLGLATLAHADSREATTAMQLAQGKIDELVKLNMNTAPAVQINNGDTLGANVANYFDTPQPAITRRWRVVAGPAANTRLLTVRVLNARARQYGAQVNLTTVIRQW